LVSTPDTIPAHLLTGFGGGVECEVRQCVREFVD
jgi:hypothetical protein